MDEKTIARFWSKVERRGADECWPWLAFIDASGYGRLGLLGGAERAHRMSLWIASGERPTGFVCHKCDVRHCVNPGHLYVGNAATNHSDMVHRGRRHNHVGSAHGRAKITEDQARAILASKGIRTQVSLAAEYGITQSNVSAIHRRAGWKHVVLG